MVYGVLDRENINEGAVTGANNFFLPVNNDIIEKNRYMQFCRMGSGDGIKYFRHLKGVTRRLMASRSIRDQAANNSNQEELNVPASGIGCLLHMSWYITHVKYPCYTLQTTLF